MASASLNFNKKIFTITPNGMLEGESENHKDGIVLFGYEPIDNIEEDIA